MKSNTASPLAASFMAWRSAKRRASFGAVALLSPLAAAPDQGAARLARSIVAEHSTDDSIADAETIGAVSRLAASDETAPEGMAAVYSLTPAERATIRAARPGARSLVLRSVAAPAADDPADLLPPDFTPAPVADFDPAVPPGLLSPAELAAIDAESAAEIARLDAERARDAAAVDFRSDFDAPAPADYAPAVVAVKVAPAPVAPVSEAEALRLAVLALRR